MINVRMVANYDVFFHSSQNPVSTDAVEGISEIHLNHGLVGWEVLEVNSTGIDCCLNPSRGTEAQLMGGQQLGDGLKGMEVTLTSGLPGSQYYTQ